MFFKMIGFIFLVTIALPFSIVGYLAAWAIGGFSAGVEFWEYLHRGTK